MMTPADVYACIDNLIRPLSSNWTEFKRVTGAKLKAFDFENATSIRFTLPRGYCSNHAHEVELFVNGLDLYCVNFYNTRGRLIDKIENVYCDMLEEIFRDHTALATRFPRFC